MEHHGGEWSYDQRHQGACEVSTAWCLFFEISTISDFHIFFFNMEDRMHSCSFSILFNLKFIFESSILSNVCVSGGATARYEVKGTILYFAMILLLLSRSLRWLYAEAD